MWNGSQAQVQNYVQGAGRNITYPVGMNGGGVGNEWGLDRSSYVVVDETGVVQYITPQATHYSQRLSQHKTEIIAKLNELVAAIGIESDDAELPINFELYQNSPNPFAVNTKIKFRVRSDKMPSSTKLVIYDILGREVKTLFSGVAGKGEYSFHWNSLNNGNNPVSAGMYIILLKSGEHTFTKKMIYSP
ncbi:T9SS type A sorting domain-containing protein [candidate division KSB1 bacterium]|nr:T9SS type A sorting domain-containing protein [candidate division KSB1 bacterium]